MTNDTTEILPADSPQELNRYEIALEKKSGAGRPREWTKPRSMALIPLLWQYITDEEVPSLEDFCFRNNYYPSLICKLSRMYPQFRGAVNDAKIMIAKKIARGCLKGTLNARFGQFYLSACHGYQQAATIVKATTESKIDATIHGNINVTFKEVAKNESITPTGPFHHTPGGAD